MTKFFCLIASFLIISVHVNAAVDPRIEWKMVHSSHFDLIYDAQQQELAQFYLDRLEKARAKLVPFWPSVPERLTVILNDRTDLTNGYATPLPYAHVMIFPALPGPHEFIAEYGDWAEEIFLHEMTHILEFEQRRGGVKFLSHIFGNIITPNILLPRWWLEGLAVDAETRLSNHGRLRSNFQDSLVRAIVSDTEKWNEVRYPEINESAIPTSPYGARPYFYGSLLWSEMIAMKGEKMIRDLHETLGGRVPYALTSPVQERFDGLDLPDLFSRAKRKVEAAVEAQRTKLSKIPFTKTEALNEPEFRESMTPKISPDGLKLAFLVRDDTMKRSIQILVRPSTQISFSPAHRVKVFGQKEQIGTPSGIEIKIPRNNDDLDEPPGGTINRISWKPDSKSFVFDLISERSLFHDVSDLWTFSLETGKAEQITKDLRAREPELSPDGERVAYVKIEAGRTSLAILDLKTGQTAVAYEPQIMDRVSWPVWLDQNRILIATRSQGTEKFQIVDLTRKVAETVPLSFKEVGLPVVRGKKVFFVANANGVRNLYETDLNFAKVRAVTHLWTGAYAADLDVAKNELWFTQMSSGGFDLVKAAYRENEKLPELPKVAPLLADRYPPREETAAAPVSMDDNENYRALPYLWPRYWLPFVYWDDKGTQISASTGGSDPLGKHAYSLFASHDSAIKRTSYAVIYKNQSFTPTLFLQASDLNSYLADADYPTRTELGAARAAWQLTLLDPNWFAGFGWTWLKREQSKLESEQNGPTLFLTYFRAQQSGEQIAPENGGTFYLSSTQFLEGGEREHYNLTSLAFTKFGKWPWLNHHAWVLRFAGQYIDRRVSTPNYESTVSTLATAAPTAPNYLMRGYVTGAFLGKSIANASAEYRFPIVRIDRGSNYFAFFSKRVSGALVADGIWLDGFGYDITREPHAYRPVDSFKGYGSAGAEVKLDFTLGYSFEMAIIMGLYSPLSTEFSDSTPRLGLALAL